MEGFGEEPIDWIGQLRLLFHCPLVGSLGNHLIIDLALIQVYENVPDDHDTKLLSCSQVKMRSTEVACGHSSKRSKQKPHYMVIDIESIVRIIQLLPKKLLDGSQFFCEHV